MEAYKTKIDSLLYKLVADPNYLNDWARARELSKLTGISGSAAQSRVSRFVRRLEKNDMPKPGIRDTDRPVTYRPNRFDAPLTCYVYVIKCLRVNHFYIGQTASKASRFRAHREGNSKFTREHGIDEIFVVTTTPTRNTALEVERMLIQVLRKKGAVVGGG